MEAITNQLAEQINGVVLNIADEGISRTKYFNWLIKIFKRSADQELDNVQYQLVPCIDSTDIVKRDVVDVLMLFDNAPEHAFRERLFQKCLKSMRFTGGKTGDGNKLWPKRSVNDGVLVFEFPRPCAFTIKIQAGATPLPGVPTPHEYVGNDFLAKYHRAKLVMTAHAASAFRIIRYLKNHKIVPWSMVDDWVLKILTRNISQGANSWVQVMARMILFFWVLQADHRVRDVFSQQWLRVLILQEDVDASRNKAEGYMTDVDLLRRELLDEGPVPFVVNPAFIPVIDPIINVNYILQPAGIHHVPAIVAQ